MNKLIVVIMLVAISGCKFDTGSNSVTKAIGKSISLGCFKSNLKNIKGLEVGTETSNTIILVGSGIKSTIEFNSANAVISSYSISTNVEKSKDSEIHKVIELTINLPCAAESLNSLTYEQAFNFAEQQWTENKENEQYKEYFNIWNTFNNENNIDERDGCYRYSKEVVKFVLVQNEDGVIEKVVTQNDDRKTKCFVKAYTGVKFPKPPLAPFYHWMTMN